MTEFVDKVDRTRIVQAGVILAVFRDDQKITASMHVQWLDAGMNPADQTDSVDMPPEWAFLNRNRLVGQVLLKSFASGAESGSLKLVESVSVFSSLYEPLRPVLAAKRDARNAMSSEELVTIDEANLSGFNRLPGDRADAAMKVYIDSKDSHLSGTDTCQSRDSFIEQKYLELLQLMFHGEHSEKTCQRSLAVARTNLETSFMWYRKASSNDKRNT